MKVKEKTRRHSKRDRVGAGGRAKLRTKPPRHLKAECRDTDLGQCGRELVSPDLEREKASQGQGSRRAALVVSALRRHWGGPFRSLMLSKEASSSWWKHQSSVRCRKRRGTPTDRILRWRESCATWGWTKSLANFQQSAGTSLPLCRLSGSLPSTSKTPLCSLPGRS